jgi:hypothetical protein
MDQQSSSSSRSLDQIFASERCEKKKVFRKTVVFNKPEGWKNPVTISASNSDQWFTGE